MNRLPHALLLPWLPACCALAACSGEAHSETELGAGSPQSCPLALPSRKPLVYGGQLASESSISESAMAVGALQVRRVEEDVSWVDLCTVARLGPSTAITAAHCFPGEKTPARIDFTPRIDVEAARCAPLEANVLSWLPHPEFDVMLVTFEASQVLSGGLRVAEVLPELGAAVTLMGYGQTETGAQGERLFIESVLVASDAQTLTVDSGEFHGTCVGDSGGPLLVWAAEGQPRLAGTLSRGSASCRGVDQYVNLTWPEISEWLASNATPPPL